MNFQEESSDRSTHEIAIIGVDCTFPGAACLDEYYQIIANKQDAITKVPAERWVAEDYYHPREGTSGKMSTQWGGFIKDIDRFDADYFSISNREAKTIDPQHRLLLQSSCKALEHANINPHALAGSNTSVFVGICHSDYEKIIYEDFSRIGGYHGPATYQCIASNRISFTLDLRGPSMSIDTACSSSLVALHTACRSLRLGESDLSIVGGINLLLRPQETIALSHAGMMGDRCHTFDEKAKGYVRAEGCATIVLKRLDAAERDNDKILAVVKGSAVNQNGMSYGITAPNGLAQQAVINSALKEANLQSQDINMIEAQGVGTSLGDPIEVAALVNVLSENRNPDDLCALGSVKSNIGHSEGASGIAGIVKAIIAIQHRQILPHRDIETTNPLVAKHLQGKPFYFPTKVIDWEQGKPLTIGVSAFGFGGTNAHVILQDYQPKLDNIESVGPSTRDSELLVVSAHSEESLVALLRDYQELFSNPVNKLALSDICATAAQKRQHRDIRIAFKVTSISDALAQIEEAITERIWSAEKKKRHSVGFMFGRCKDMQYFDECVKKLSGSNAFYSAINACSSSLEKITNKQDSAPPAVCDSLTELLSTTFSTCTPGQAEALKSFVVQYAAAKMWASWGIVPKKVNGVGVGCIVAAAVADIFSLDTAIQLTLLLAERNSHKSQNKSEVTTEITSLLTALSSVTARTMLLPAKCQDAASLASWLADAFYRENASESIETFFDAKTTKILNLGYEGSPEPGSQLVVNSNVCGQDPWATIMFSVASLYRHKIPIDWEIFYHGFHKHFVSIPTYRFSRTSFWFNTTIGYQPQVNSEIAIHPLLGEIRSIAYEGGEILSAQTKILVSQFPYIFDHTLYGKIVFPAAAFIEIFIAASDNVFGEDGGMLSNISIREALTVSNSAANHVIYIQSKIECIASDTYQVSVFSTVNNPGALGSKWVLHAQATLVEKSANQHSDIKSKNPLPQDLDDFCSSSYYQRLTEIGLCYGESMRNISSIVDVENTVIANIAISHRFSDQRYVLNPALIDGCLQAAGKLCLKPTSRSALVPVGFDRITKLAPLDDSVYCTAFLSEQTTIKKKKNLIDMVIRNKNGEIALVIEKMHLVSARKNKIEGSLASSPGGQLAANLSNVYSLPKKGAALANRRVLSQVKNAPEDREKVKVLNKYLQENFAKVLELPRVNMVDLDEGFFNIGLTSLLVNELKSKLENELELEIESSVLFDYPNIRALSRYLVDELSKLGTNPSDLEKKPTIPSFLHSSNSVSKNSIAIDEYNDEDLERLLVKKLDELEV